MSRKWIRWIVLSSFLLFFYLLFPTTTTVPIFKQHGKLTKNIPKIIDLELPSTEYQSHFIPEYEPIVYPTTNHYFTKEQSTLLDESIRNRLVSISGFSFCSILDVSLFDVLVPIRDFGGSLADINPDKSDVINLIDFKAYDIYQAMMRKFHMANQWEVQRLACYIAGEGKTIVANMTYERLLVGIDPVHYFQKVLPAIVPTPSRIVGKRKKYKLAYLVMVHDKNGFKQLVHLLKLLDDGDAIILIHVDARKQSQQLFHMVDDWIQQRSKTIPHSSIFMATHRFSNIWGHISLVFTQLSGFWELLDLADWDYIINMSNYDYPIKTNHQIHTFLSMDSHKNKNFIEYWPDTSDLAERFYRVHLGESDFSSVYHPSELGVVTWPFTHWKAMKHHQWVILTPEVIHFFRTDQKALMFLAFAEHSFIPDESYFATVLVNTPRFKKKIVNNNKRYLRFVQSAHPSWLGYKDRYLFPPYEKEASFYFIRKVNSLGNVFEEKKLISWIKEHHYTTNVPGPCHMEHIGVRMECLRELGSSIAYKNQLIVIPINEPLYELVLNLVCSLEQVGIQNILFWALDIESYERLLHENKLVMILSGINPMPTLEKRKSKGLISMMRNKPNVIEKILEAGFDCWFLDGDTIVLEDFRNIQDPSDVFISIEYQLEPHKPSGSMMFFRNNENTKKMLRMYQLELQKSSLLDDEDALIRILHQPKTMLVLEPDFSSLFTQSNQKQVPGPIPTIRYLDPNTFLSFNLDRGHKFPQDINQLHVIHVQRNERIQEILSSFGLWFLKQDQTCDFKPKGFKPTFPHS